MLTEVKNSHEVHVNVLCRYPFTLTTVVNVFLYLALSSSSQAYIERPQNSRKNYIDGWTKQYVKRFLHIQLNFMMFLLHLDPDLHLHMEMAAKSAADHQDGSNKGDENVCFDGTGDVNYMHNNNTQHFYSAMSKT